jgi:hypothetical protein
MIRLAPFKYLAGMFISLLRTFHFSWLRRRAAEGTARTQTLVLSGVLLTIFILRLRFSQTATLGLLFTVFHAGRPSV